MLSALHRATLRQSRHFKPPQIHTEIMPLVVPGMMGQGGGEDKTNSWMSKLAGKTLGDSHSETVCSALP